MLNATFRPLTQWPPGPRTGSKKEGQFKATWLKTLDLLEYELGKLRAQDVVIQIEDPEAIKGIRNDGSIRIVSQKYYRNLSGVVLSFESPKGNISMPCDRYYYWQDNLRAIALSLEALRAVDRYGVTSGNEQYRGWTALPDPKSNGMDRQHAITFLALLTGVNSVVLAKYDKAMLAEILKQQRIANHPDHGTGPDDIARRQEISLKIGQAETVLMSAKGGGK